MLAFLHILKDDEAAESTVLEALELAEVNPGEVKSEEQQEKSSNEKSEKSAKADDYSEAMKLLRDVSHEQNDLPSCDEDIGVCANGDPLSFTSKLKNYCKSKDKNYNEALELLNDISQEDEGVTLSKPEDLGVPVNKGNEEGSEGCMKEKEDIGVCVNRKKKRKRENMGGNASKPIKKSNKNGEGNSNQSPNSTKLEQNGFSKKRKWTEEDSGKNKRIKSHDTQAISSDGQSKFKKKKKKKSKKAGRGQ